MRNLAMSVAIAATVFATSSRAAEIVGNVVSTDPTAQTIEVRTPDGESLTILTNESTRIEQGSTAVDTETLVPGMPVEIQTTGPAAAQASLQPTATRIVVVPAAQQDDDVDDDDDDVDIDIDDDDADSD